MMKIYGEAAEVQKHMDFMEMSSIAISLSPEAMETFASFVMHAASEMKRIGPGYDHVHFMDFCKDWDPAWPDIQLTQVYEDPQDS
ncbi:hypothetical protein [Massilia sp. 9I]|uniref:hypothetical protein n=1 Tax=Massilia sp. 9I TaxID=2653152 RepID=UPI0012EFF3D6|nr:hypothetical protein [Massilia sp. 9I]VXB62430.1 conserved hypothetical protein [Massilia sp. 9I]